MSVDFFLKVFISMKIKSKALERLYEGKLLLKIMLDVDKTILKDLKNKN